MAVQGLQHSEHRRALHTQDPGDREGGAGGGLVWGRPFPFPPLGPSLAHTLSLQALPRTELTESQPCWWLPRALGATGQVAETVGSPGERAWLLSPTACQGTDRHTSSLSGLTGRTSFPRGVLFLAVAWLYSHQNFYVSPLERVVPSASHECLPGTEIKTLQKSSGQEVAGGMFSPVGWRW